jgi:hypothetical protein
LKELKGIHEHGSLKMSYNNMYNQCLVLSVSYFTSTIHSIFKEFIGYVCANKPEELKGEEEDFKITLKELKKRRFQLVEWMGDLIIQKKGITFQDMQSVQREFKTYFNIDLPRDNNTNNIIFALASRHLIVHALGVVEEKFLYQIRDTYNKNDKTVSRTIKIDLQKDKPLQFAPEEIIEIQKSMEAYIKTLMGMLVKTLKINS